jgi:glycosyltransferase involved in cell wall biosynthesis
LTFGLLILSLNELDGMKAVLPRIRKEWLDEIVIMDGGSTDGSVEYAESLGFKVTRQTTKGLTPGTFEGLAAIKSDYVITFTPDNNMIPEKIPLVIEKLKEGYDMVVVSRFMTGAKSDDDTVVTGFGNWLFTTLVNVLFGTKYTDVLGFYRGYPTSMIKELHIEQNVTLDTQLNIRCAKMGKKVIEIPGDEPPRIGGKSSRTIFGNGSAELMTILKEFCRR